MRLGEGKGWDMSGGEGKERFQLVSSTLSRVIQSLSALTLPCLRSTFDRDLGAFYRGWFVVVHPCSNFSLRRQMAPLQSIKFQTADFLIFCTRIIVIFWATCIIREVFSCLTNCSMSSKTVCQLFNCFFTYKGDILYDRVNSCPLCIGKNGSDIARWWERW